MIIKRKPMPESSAQDKVEIISAILTTPRPSTDEAVYRYRVHDGI